MSQSLSDGQKLMRIGFWIGARASVLACAILLAKFAPIAVRLI